MEFDPGLRTVGQRPFSRFNPPRWYDPAQIRYRYGYKNHSGLAIRIPHSQKYRVKEIIRYQVHSMNIRCTYGRNHDAMSRLRC